MYPSIHQIMGFESRNGGSKSTRLCALVPVRLNYMRTHTKHNNEPGVDASTRHHHSFLLRTCAPAHSRRTRAHHSGTSEARSPRLRHERAVLLILFSPITNWRINRSPRSLSLLHEPSPFGHAMAIIITTGFACFSHTPQPNDARSASPTTSFFSRSHLQRRFFLLLCAE